MRSPANDDACMSPYVRMMYAASVSGHVHSHVRVSKEEQQAPVYANAPRKPRAGVLRQKLVNQDVGDSCTVFVNRVPQKRDA